MEVNEVQKKKHTPAAERSFDSLLAPRKMPPIKLRPRRNRYRTKFDADLRSLDSIAVAERKVLAPADMLSPFPAKLGLPDLASDDEEEPSPRMVPTPFCAHEVNGSAKNTSKPSSPFRSPKGLDEELFLLQDDLEQERASKSKTTMEAPPRRLFFLESSITPKTDLPRPRPQRAEDAKAAAGSASAGSRRPLHFSPSSAFQAKRRKTTTA